jgi:hypothetical protein
MAWVSFITGLHISLTAPPKEVSLKKEIPSRHQCRGAGWELQLPHGVWVFALEERSLLRSSSIYRL